MLQLLDVEITLQMELSFVIHAKINYKRSNMENKK